MVDSIYIVVGEKVRSLRMSVGLSQASLADRVGLSRSSVANIERGRQVVLVHQLITFGRALGVDARELLPTSQEVEVSSVGDDQLPEEMRDLIERLDKSGYE